MYRNQLAAHRQLIKVVANSCCEGKHEQNKNNWLDIRCKTSNVIDCLRAPKAVNDVRSLASDIESVVLVLFVFSFAAAVDRHFRSCISADKGDIISVSHCVTNQAVRSTLQHWNEQIRSLIRCFCSAAVVSWIRFAVQQPTLMFHAPGSVVSTPCWWCARLSAPSDNPVLQTFGGLLRSALGRIV